MPNVWKKYGKCDTHYLECGKSSRKKVEIKFCFLILIQKYLDKEKCELQYYWPTLTVAESVKELNIIKGT